MALFPYKPDAYICELLYKNLKQASFAHTFGASAVLYLYQSMISQEQLILLIVLFFLIFVFRGVLYLSSLRDDFAEKNVDNKYKLFLLGTFLAGSTWGITVILLFSEHNPASYQLLIMLVASGFMGGAALTQSADKLSMLLFSIPIISSIILSLLYANDAGYHLLAGLLTALYIPIIFAAMNSSEASFRLYQSATIEKQMNQAKTDFLANMSHEIRTPLNAVVGLGYLLKETDLSTKQQGYISQLQQASSSLLSLINSILDFSRIEARQMDLESIPFDLNEVIDAVTTNTKIQADKKSLHFSIELDNNVETQLIGDPLKLIQVLTNLSTNGVKFTKKGKITIQIYQSDSGNDKAQLEFKVSDTGLGIKEQDQSKLFEPFTQLNASDTRIYGGTGLGLTISQHLLSMMKSEMKVDSVVDVGSTFSFSICFEINASEHLNKNTYHSNMPPVTLELIPELYGKKILIVDDDKLNQSVAKEILEKFGLSVRTSSSAKQAFLLLNEARPDLIFMDLQMPIMSGYEALDILRKTPEWKDIPVIALTANASTTEKKKALGLGMNEFLTKPINPQQLKLALLKWIPHEKIENGNVNDVVKNPLKIEKKILTSKEEVEKKLKSTVSTLGYEFSTKLFKSTIDVISKEGPLLFNLLRENKKSEANDFAHKLKGAVGLFSSTKLEDLLTQIEEKDVNFNDLDTLFTELQAEFDLIQLLIKSVGLTVD